jgi:serine protease AprX
MSFSGPVRSYYWDDPLNLAVMKAWQSGIVVVASAGNTGPDPMTIGVPGNVPYIITVGAVTDSYTSNFDSDDKIASFSAAGPTVEGFVKPEIIAPGGHVSGLMSFDSQLVSQHPEFHDGGRYFEMSGTSQAAAVVSGVVALILTNDPTLTPDEVKCRIMDSAKAAKNNDGSLAYSVFQQGAGLINAEGALSSSASNCANSALNIDKDLAGESHYYGPSNIDEDGNFYIEGMSEDYIWNVAKESLAGDVLIWKNNFETDVLIWKNSATTDVLIWKNNFETDVLIWKNSVETDVLIWKNNFSDSEAATIGVNSWVEQQ